MKENTIVLTAGGTGGHIFPAQALATWLKENHPEYKIIFITDARGKKNLSGALANIPVYYVKASGITGKGIFYKISAAFKLLFGSMQSVCLLMKLNPKMLIAFGGYASVPATMAAEFLRIPVILHEQNAILGRANRLLAKKGKVRAVATSFTPTGRVPAGISCIQTGMPVRPQIQQKSDAPYPTDTQEFRLLIIGGSQGAHAFSELLPKALILLPQELKQKLSLTQQVRAEDMEKVEQTYQNSGIKNISLAPFFNNIPELLEKTHLIISRSGSSSLAEFSQIGRPAVLIPLPTSADDHQTANAKLWTANGGGWLIIEKDATPESIATRLAELMNNVPMLQQAATMALKGKPKEQAGEALGKLVINELEKSK
ncbi:MAG: undecaprenyldiphospho-muramoylpentapeptide beta-N-acetylglucosaminyltransferase [Alphaproteobacteria bacterium]